MLELGCGRRHGGRDVADGGIEHVGKALHFACPFLPRGACLGFLLLRFAARALDRLELERLDARGDLADLVLAPEPGQHDVEIAEASSFMLEAAASSRRVMPRPISHAAAATPRMMKTMATCIREVVEVRDAASRVSLSWLTRAVSAGSQ